MGARTGRRGARGNWDQDANYCRNLVVLTTLNCFELTKGLRRKAQQSDCLREGTI